MTSPAGTTSATAQAQQAINDALRSWSDNVGRIASSYAPTASVPNLVELVETSFNLAEQLLATQREVTLGLVGAFTTAADEATKATSETAAAAATAAHPAAPKPPGVKPSA